MSGLGYLGVFTSVICFGSNFVPLKRIKIGDGVFFQFIMCNGIFMTAIPVLLIQDFPPIHGLALLGGVLWTTGNMLCPVAIRLIGMGMGLLVWGSVSMVMGWASGFFGLFGLKKQEISDKTLNIVGILIVLVGLIVFLQVKTIDTSIDSQKVTYDKLSKNENDTLDNQHSISSPLVAVVDDTDVELVSRPMKIKTAHDTEADFFDGWTDQSKRILGLVFASIAGLLFGNAFNPSQYVNDHDYNGNDDPLNYVFSHYTGILLSSWFYTMLYCLYKGYKGERPYIPGDVMIPGTISGVLWGIAQACWFYANGSLGFAVTFPITSSGPGFVGCLWSIFLFKEIAGTRNFAFLGTAFAITVAGLICVALSH